MRCAAINEKIEFRRYKPSDFDFLLSLFVQTVTAVNAADYSSEQIAAWLDIDPHRWAVSLKENYTVVALKDKEIVGFADLGNSHIDRLYVGAGFQHCGIGSSLLSILEDQAKIRKLTKLDVAVSLTARRFFESHNYTIKKEQIVLRHGIAIPNFKMEKKFN